MRRPCPVCLSLGRLRRDERTRSAGALPMKERGKHSASGITGSFNGSGKKSPFSPMPCRRATTDGGKTRSNELRVRFSFRETKLNPPWKSGTIRKQSDRLTLIRLRRGQVGSAAQKPCAPFPASLLPERLLAALLYAAGREMSPPFKCSEGRLPSCSRYDRLMKPRGGVWRAGAGAMPLCAFCDDGRC